MRFAPTLMCASLLLGCLSCSRSDAPPAPSFRIEGEITVRSTEPDASCKLAGSFHAPRQQAQRVDGTNWKGAATDVVAGDVVVLTASIDGVNPWACEAECSLHQAGTTNKSTSKTSPLPKRPAPTCPACSRGEVTCIFDVPR